ncbi:MAG: glycosyltransferase family 2 protein [Deltaproteobacteria bacterium]|nr:glycosyltransferase family 2 protein [Deltaproteobacteria bacterium]
MRFIPSKIFINFISCYSIWLYSIPIIFSLISACVFLLLGISRITRKNVDKDSQLEDDVFPLIQILIPVTGVTDKSREILETLLVQDYPNYRVTFVVENESDPVFNLVKEFCAEYKHVAFIVSGAASKSGQKNFGLVKAVSALAADVEILVFCDSTNVARADWLKKISRPVRYGRFEVCTTFRSFVPETINVPGVCQAIYATTVFALLTVMPKPWGGATVIRKSAFDRLDVSKVWSNTVVDDLTLGNILNKANVKIYVSRENFLWSPIKKQTFKRLFAFLDRQILFPKFTNPGIWAFTVFWHISLCVSLVMSSIGLISCLFGVSMPEFPIIGGVFWIGILTLLTRLKSVNQEKIPITKWLAAFPVLVFVATFICVRSIFLDYIDWYGKRYYCSYGGKVSEIREV